MSKNFDEKQQQLVQFIYDFTKQNGYTPSVREMCDKMHFASTSTIFYYLTKCEEQGIIKRAKGKNRAIELVDVHFEDGVPVVGKVAAGEPILAVENVEDYMKLDEKATLYPPQPYVAQPGDLQILANLQKLQPPSNGDTAMLPFTICEIACSTIFIE